MSDSTEVSLFDDYALRNQDLGLGYVWRLTPEGAAIFSSTLNAEKVRHLSRVLGGLAYHRSTKPLTGPVVVVEADVPEAQYDIVMPQAVDKVIEHLIAIQATTVDGTTTHEDNGLVTRQARLVTGGYVTVQVSPEQARVLLSPTTSFEI